MGMATSVQIAFFPRLKTLYDARIAGLLHAVIGEISRFVKIAWRHITGRVFYAMTGYSIETRWREQDSTASAHNVPLISLSTSILRTKSYDILKI